MLRTIDLFSGAAGGWSLGLHRTGGFETVMACEADPWRREQYGRNFPHAVLHDDVRTFRPGYGSADVVVGSPPCQNISAANSTARGVDGDGLFFEAIRIVGEVRPRWACFENSPALRTRGIDRVIGGLAALDYACWPLVVGAQDVGANHLRRRVWVLAYSRERGDEPTRSRPPSPGWRVMGAQAATDAADSDGQPLWQQPGRSSGPHWADTAFAGFAVEQDWGAWAPDSSSLDDGIPEKLVGSAIAAYGDAIVPQIAEAIGRAILHVDARL